MEAIASKERNVAGGAIRRVLRLLLNSSTVKGDFRNPWMNEILDLEVEGKIRFSRNQVSFFLSQIVAGIRAFLVLLGY